MAYDLGKAEDERDNALKAATKADESTSEQRSRADKAEGRAEALEAPCVSEGGYAPVTLSRRLPHHPPVIREARKTPRRPPYLGVFCCPSGRSSSCSPWRSGSPCARRQLRVRQAAAGDAHRRRTSDKCRELPPVASSRFDLLQEFSPVGADFASRVIADVDELHVQLGPDCSQATDVATAVIADASPCLTCCLDLETLDFPLGRVEDLYVWH